MSPLHSVVIVLGIICAVVVYHELYVGLVTKAWGSEDKAPILVEVWAFVISVMAVGLIIFGAGLFGYLKGTGGI